MAAPAAKILLMHVRHFFARTMLFCFAQLVIIVEDAALRSRRKSKTCQILSGDEISSSHPAQMEEVLQGTKSALSEGHLKPD